jgi:polysaccharide export outer membrane protein
VQYLQHEDVSVSNVQVDSVVRTYNLIPFEYRIQPYDVLFLQITSLTDEKFDLFGGGNSQISGGQGNSLQGTMVDTDGNIEFPVAGRMKVAGLTIFEIEGQIQQMAYKYVDDPVVRVRLMNFRFTVLGEVSGEGTFNTFNQRITLAEALGLAGGLSEIANRAQIKVIRQKGDIATVHYVNLLNEDLLLSPYYYLNQNDLIIVPPLKQRPFRTYFRENVGIFVTSLSTLLLVITLILR